MEQMDKEQQLAMYTDIISAATHSFADHPTRNNLVNMVLNQSGDIQLRPQESEDKRTERLNAVKAIVDEAITRLVNSKKLVLA